MSLTAEQIELRREGLGSSDIAAIAGLLAARQPISVYEEKTTGLSTVDPDDPLIRLGQHLEAGLADHYAWLTGTRLRELGTLTHAQHDWMLATPDRVVIGIDGQVLRNVEIKTAGPWVKGEWGKEADEIPEAYIAQAAWQMAVLDVDETDLVALVAGEFRIYPLKRDRELERDLIALGQRFWHQHVLAKKPPPIDGSAAYSGFLRRAFPKPSGAYLPAGSEHLTLGEAYRAAQAEAKAAEAKAEAAKQALMAAMGPADGIDGVCTWRADKNGRRTFRIKGE